jgi:hypothetical protein
MYGRWFQALCGERDWDPNCGESEAQRPAELVDAERLILRMTAIANGMSNASRFPNFLPSLVQPGWVSYPSHREPPLTWIRRPRVPLLIQFQEMAGEVCNRLVLIFSVKLNVQLKLSHANLH